MGDEKQPSSLSDLAERLRAARKHRGADTQQEHGLSGGPPGMSGLGWAFRIGVEMVSALIVGVGIGYALDWWLGTKPWFLVVFFLLGAGAAIVNVYRAAMGFGLAVGYKDAGEGEEEREGKAQGKVAGETGGETSRRDSGGTEGER
jgi:ATP synthase protein I